MNAEVRNAIRMIREHYDKKTLLESGNMFSNALGDMLGEDGKKLRIQVQLALSAGVGRMYLEQGAAPNADFYGRVQSAMEGCGLSPQIAAELREIFDEAAGWAQPAPVEMPEQPAPKEEKMHGTTEERSSRVLESAPAQKEEAAASAAAFSIKRALTAAILPLAMVLLYVILDRFFMEFVRTVQSLSASPFLNLTFSRMINDLHWYQYLIPLVLPQLMAVLSVPAAWLLFRRKGDPFANCYLTGGLIGLAGILAALNTGWLIAPATLPPFRTAFGKWVYGIFSLLSFDFSYFFRYSIVRTRIFYLLGISILFVILGTVVAKEQAKHRNGVR